jgi:citrate lyase subunit beta/citryl-CoA lyase
VTNYSARDISAARSFLFVPGNRSERFPKAGSAAPDIVIIDSEDAVAASDKDTARANARSWLQGGNAAMLRINATETAWYREDAQL